MGLVEKFKRSRHRAKADRAFKEQVRDWVDRVDIEHPCSNPQCGVAREKMRRIVR